VPYNIDSNCPIIRQSKIIFNEISSSYQKNIPYNKFKDLWQIYLNYFVIYCVAIAPTQTKLIGPNFVRFALYHVYVFCK